MKKILNLVVAVLLFSCTAREVNAPPEIAGASASPIVQSTSTRLPAPTSTPAPLEPVTGTPGISCDPSTADFCVTEGHFILQRPIQRPANDFVDPTYQYASTANGRREPHHGVEFPNPTGTPVHAAANGTVVFAGPDSAAVYSPWRNFYGNLVVLQHTDNLFTLYAHLSRIDVQLGQSIIAGDKLGEVGMSGGAIGSHLHFEVRHGDGEDYFSTLNPELWLMPAKGPHGVPFGTLAISIFDDLGGLVKHASVTAEYYPDPSKPPLKFHYGVSYAPDLLGGNENAVLGELPAGMYRIAMEAQGQIQERWVEVKSGKLTQVHFVVP